MRRTGKGPNRRGSIYEAPRDSGIWWAQLPADELGRRPKRSARSAEAAVQKMIELEQERQSGVNVSDNPTVAQLFATWLQLSIKPNVKASTLASYRYLCDHYINPHIGRVKVRKLTALRVQHMLAALGESGLSASTIILLRKRLIAALDQAMRWKLVTENVAKEATAPKSDSLEVQTLTADMARKFLDTVADTRLAALYYLALATGMRQAELIGLRWIDVHFETREIRISSQVHRRKKQIERTTTKTNKARTIPMDDTLIAVLQSVWKNQQEERRITDDWKEHGLVFPSERGTPLFASALWMHFKASLRRASLPDVRFHSLRHTAATLMLANGVPLPDVSAILGHANPAITARLYLHSHEDGKRRAVETMGQLLQRRAS